MVTIDGDQIVRDVGEFRGHAQEQGAPRRVAELSGTAYDRPTWISADECRMYLDRHTATGVYEIYLAERLP